LLEDTLLELRKQGRTILFSTHRMDQVEKLCDNICLVNKGAAVLSGNLREIKKRYGHNRVQIAFDGAQNGHFLAGNPLASKVDPYEGYVSVELAPGATAQQLLREVSSQSAVSRFEVMEPSLEEIFIDVVGKTDA
jgi:ABC-2 type transport system ATP-binding protein